jgi:hypothetical protein
MNEDLYVEWDGAYVLGALDPGERSEYEAHLADCPECRASVEQLRPTVTVLSRARAAGLTEHAEPMPDTLLPGLLRRATHERNRRRTITTVLGAAVAACLVTLAIVLWPGSDTSNAPASVAMTALRPSPVSANAALVAKAWGTEIDLQCRYNEPVKESFPYKLRVIDTSGKYHDGGSWKLAAGREITFTGGTDVPRQDIEAVQITFLDGTPILQLDA